MKQLFVTVLNMSLTASAVIAAVLVFRLALKKTPKIYSYILWAVVLFRLLCPVSFSSELAPLHLTAPETVKPVEGFSYVSYLPQELEISQQAAVGSGQLPSQEALAPQITAMDIGTALWLCGMGVMALYSLVVLGKLRKDLVGAMPAGDGIMLADHIDSAFVLGIVRPVIYLPSGLPGQERELILAHERHHIFRSDHIVKLLAWIALSIHWFNPFVWAAYFLAGKDMEMSCDEAVIRKLGARIRSDYAQALLHQAMGQRIISFTPLAFGEGDTKGRVINMSKWKKPKLWTSVLCAVVCLAILVACAANPEAAEPSSSQPNVVAMGSFSLVLPNRFGHELSERGGAAFTLDGNTIGGLEYYYYPEDISELSANEIAEAIELPDTLLEYGAYMGGDSKYADQEINYFDELSPESWNRMHYFYCLDDGAYDLWFDENSVVFDDYLPILTSVAIAVPSVPGPEELRTENQALEKCMDVLMSIQSSPACWIQTEKTNESEIVLNDTSTTNYYRSGENWLCFTDVPMQGILDGVPVWFDRFANMYADGIWYDNMANGGLTEDMRVHWNKAEPSQIDPPWLLAYTWDMEAVQYITTLPDGSGEAILLQIMSPYLDKENAFEEYYVTFHFTSDGAFRYAEIQASLLIQEDSEYTFTARETIVSLDQQLVDQEIERERQLAASQ